MLAIATLLFWMVTFPALVGLLAGWGFWHGARLPAALASLAIAVLLVVGMATRRPWRRTPSGDERPVLVRLSTFVMTVVLVPNVLFGAVVLSRRGPALTYRQSVAVGLLLSAIQAASAGVDRWQRRRRADRGRDRGGG